jgi:O-antigen ligase
MGLVNEKGGGASAHSRVTNAKFSIDKINKSPFWGYGIRSYGYEMTRIDYLDYPHNLFLEVWFELGYIPLHIFLFLFYRVYTHIYRATYSWCLALYFYFLLNILKSSSLIDIRMMLGFYAIFTIVDYIGKEDKKDINFLRKEIWIE